MVEVPCYWKSQYKEGLLGALKICWGHGPFCPPSGFIHWRGFWWQVRSGATSLCGITVHSSVSTSDMAFIQVYKGLCISGLGVQSVLCTYIFIFSSQPLSGFDLWRAVKWIYVYKSAEPMWRHLGFITFFLGSFSKLLSFFWPFLSSLA